MRRFSVLRRANSRESSQKQPAHGVGRRPTPMGNVAESEMFPATKNGVDNDNRGSRSATGELSASRASF
jgi:hypothetical protein